MKMENLYYTPSIEEFHVGFEYELQVDIWNGLTGERMWSLVQMDHLDRPTSPSRVKYLDREDIENLGWKYIGKAVDVWFEKEGSFDMGSWNTYKIKMHYGLNDHRLSVIAYDTGDEYRIFSGIIKNKSEFKKLMQQLNIV